MEAIATKSYVFVVLLLSMIAMLGSVSAHTGYGVEGYFPSKETKEQGKPVIPKEEGYEHPKNLAVQGLIYCKSGSKLIPLKGAIARVSCLAVHKNGQESAPFSFLSCPADKNGYFLAKISPSKLHLWKLTECKAFLENSPWGHCRLPEDTNGGITGARLTSSRLLKGYHLSSVGPFIYTSGPPQEGY
ncbi:hypothetical protein OSB04_022889 [Centaurea solstitialis]|uniref:Uncharacterized protein n=1 Tax=Centaurea solstitialis TaxID=347529 RepID=A0AA38W1S2_9ASTR|nr:hypothetical protein OSB04_022889 [Centaurea solstitialis]